MPNVEAEPAPAVVPNPSNNTQMFQIFQNVQYNVLQHKKYVKEMTKLYKKMAETSFRESFKNALHYLFTFGDTSANVDRVVQFVATFCTSLDDEEEFLLFIFDIIFNCQCVSGQSVRYRASQLLAAVLSALGDDASLDDDLCDKLLASQMDRLQDTRGAVRCRAALALQRLQNPNQKDDEVTRAYRFHMSCDPSSSVRRAIVMSIAKCTSNAPFVLERLCDVDEAVRRAAFLYIAAINVTQLRVKYRLLVLKVGLNERSPRVRRVVEEILIPGWLSTFKGNIIDLLKAIRLDNSTDAKDSQQVAGKMLESLFKRLPVSELLEWLPTDKTLRLIPAEKLNKETAWYWRHLAKHLQKIDDDETLETVLPDLVVLTGYIKAIVESPCPSEVEDPVGFSTRQYVLHELACLLHTYDAGDHAGRTALQELITDVLTGDYGPLNPDVIRAFVTSLEMVIPEVSQRMEVIAGVISALREPPEVEAPSPVPVAPVESTEMKLQRARLRVSLNVAMEAQEEAVREQNYALAEECKAKVQDIQKKLEEMVLPALPPSPPPPPPPTIREKISDPVTLNKCLNILNCALDTPQLTSVTPMLRMIFNDLEVEIFQNPDILESALETVALFGILDKEFAKENKAFFFANLIDTSNEPIVTIVLRCLVDLLCVHGAKVFEEDDVTQNESQVGKKTLVTYDAIDEDGNLSESALSMSPQHSTVIELMLKIMDSTCSTYRLIIAEGLCRLLYLGHLESPTILSRLLLLWFNPVTVDEDMLRQIIGVFFQSFASTAEGAQEQIQKATIPTLRALANAPANSPIADIDHETVVRFIVSLTRINHELTDSQGSMAMTLCSHLVHRPTSYEAGLICRMLALLSPPRDATIASDLAAMLRDLCLKMPDKQSCRNLTRYLGALEVTERASMNKMSQTGVTEATNGTMQAEDTMARIGRNTTSLPQPIARSTHVVINETVEEAVEVDETSPTDAMSKIPEALEPQHNSTGKESITTALEPQHNSTGKESITTALEPQHNSTGKESVTPIPIARSSTMSVIHRPSDNVETDQAKDAMEAETDSSGASPVKRAKIGKGKKKKLSMNRDPDPETPPKGAKRRGKGSKKKINSEDGEKAEREKNTAGGVKRSRSQRSLEDIERAVHSKEKNAEPSSLPPSPLDSNLRRSSRSCSVLSSPGTDSIGSTKKTENDEIRPTGNKKKGGKAKRNKGKNTEPSEPLPASPPDTNLRRASRSSSILSSLGTDSSGSGKKMENDEIKAAGNKKKGGKAAHNKRKNAEPSKPLPPSPPDSNLRRSSRSSSILSSPLTDSSGSGKNTENDEIKAAGNKKKGGKGTKSDIPSSPLTSIPSFESTSSDRSEENEKKGAGDGKKKDAMVVMSSPKSDLVVSNIASRRSTRPRVRSSSSSEYTSCMSTPSQDDAVAGLQRDCKAISTPKFDLDSSNVTVRRSTRVGSNTSSPVTRKDGGKAVSSPMSDLDSSNVTVRRSTRVGPYSSSPFTRRDGDKAISTPKFDLDSSNVTVRRATRVGSNTSSPVTRKDAGKAISTPKFDLDSSNVTVRRATRVGSNTSSPVTRKDAGKAISTPKFDLDSSNVTIRRSTRVGPNTSSPVTRKVGGKAIGTPKFDLDSSNVTVRRSTRSTPVTTNKSGKVQITKKPAAKKAITTKKSASPRQSPRSTRSSQASLFEDSADETELHTIVYDQELAQSLLDDSTELAENKSVSRTRNVTIPETPDGSEESESEPEIINLKGKAKRDRKKK